MLDWRPLVPTDVGDPHKSFFFLKEMYSNAKCQKPAIVQVEYTGFVKKKCVAIRNRVKIAGPLIQKIWKGSIIAWLFVICGLFVVVGTLRFSRLPP